MTDTFHVCCPECGSTLVVDSTTGGLLEHRPSRAPQPSAAKSDFDALLAGIDEGRAKAEARFAQEMSAHENRDQLLERKFEEAKKRAEAEGDLESRPERPWDHE